MVKRVLFKQEEGQRGDGDRQPHFNIGFYGSFCPLKMFLYRVVGNIQFGSNFIVRHAGILAKQIDPALLVRQLVDGGLHQFPVFAGDEYFIGSGHLLHGLLLMRMVGFAVKRYFAKRGITKITNDSEEPTIKFPDLCQLRSMLPEFNKTVLHNFFCEGNGTGNAQSKGIHFVFVMVIQFPEGHFISSRQPVQQCLFIV